MCYKHKGHKNDSSSKKDAGCKAPAHGCLLLLLGWRLVGLVARVKLTAACVLI
jgi:hypothetical protein